MSIEIKSHVKDVLNQETEILKKIFGPISIEKIWLKKES